VRARALLALLPLATLALAEPSPEERLKSLQRDIARLRREAASLAGREQGLLGELQRLDAERTLKQSVETIRSCARFAQAQAPKLAQWMKAESR